MEGIKSVAKNKKAFFDYEILSKFEAGIVLSGSEVKSVRAGNVNLKGGFIKVIGKDAILFDVHIGHYKYSSSGFLKDFDEKRQRKLLLHKKEIEDLRGRLNTEGIAVVPLEMYFKKGLIKILVGIGKGKKKFDKRESIKKREQEREIRGKMKRWG